MTELSSLHYRPDGPSPLANRSIASEPILYESYVGTNGVVIIGGGLAAVRTAEQLRRAGSGLAEDLPITVVSNETHAPYDRPPLSKDMLVDPGKGVTDVALKPAEFYAEHAITLRLGAAANSVDATEQTVVLDDGSVLGYDELVIATGLVPKRIPSLPDLAGIRVLRSVEDSLALREHAAKASRAVIVGAGFIGCEVAAALRKLGVDVVLVEPQAAPLACSGLTTYSAIRKLQPLAPDDWVAVIGCGGLGLMALAVLRGLGHRRVIACDIDDAKLAVARA